MRKTLLLAPLCALTLLVGCGSEPAPETPETEDSPAAEVKTDVPEATLASLKAADLLDGTEDQVIGKCYTCSLGMDGSEDFAVDVHGYKVHLCSESCQKHFEESADDVIASTDIPKSE